MAEPVKNKKPSLRQLLDDIAEDEEFSDEDRQLAKDKLLEMEYKDWSSRIKRIKEK